jgi:cytochrome P450
MADIVILPVSTLEEVRNLPENRVSSSKIVAAIMHTKYTGLVLDNPELIAPVKVYLTRHIKSNLDRLQDEIKYAFDKELGPCQDWTPFYTYLKLSRIVSLLSGRLFVGLPLSREEEWIDVSVNYTRDVVIARDAITRKSWIIRRFVAPFLPEVKSVKAYGDRGAKLLEPLINALLARGEKAGDRPEEEMGTMVSWMLKYTNDKSMRAMADNQMALSFVAISTTTSTVCQAVFDLVSRPEYIQPLRDEIEQVITEDGQDTTDSGYLKFKKQSLPKLRKLDSFLKESQRFNPLLFATMHRYTTVPLKLSTGHTIPKGVHIAYPAYDTSLSLDSTTFSPSYDSNSYTPPHEFDGFRFEKLRAMEGKENTVYNHLPPPCSNHPTDNQSQHQFVTTAPDSLYFGYGLHACPGRFFASSEIKIVMIELLRSWDVRLKGDVEGRGGIVKRPKNRQFKMALSPDVMAELEFRRRKV